ncbi:unnamed protein product [Leptidea sinapis]|uniref:Serpin domain-containing protein n=2 Tax=Leptidea sinapis TaxID=189913 RepID=A0A5E4QM42_9NEOP|nr:unnamed protein product [Leptidea sinapis]
MRALLCVVFIVSINLCMGDTVVPAINQKLREGVSERIGNFSIELLYYTTRLQERNTNLIISPVTVWTILAVISEGAEGNTQKEICGAIRTTPKLQTIIRNDFRNIAQYLQVNTSTVELKKLNIMFINKKNVKEDFIERVKFYDTSALTLNFSDSNVLNKINSAVSAFTNNKIMKLVEADDLANSEMILTSALYFKGKWKVPFNTSSTTQLPFYNSAGKEIGKVNMMYNRYSYPFASIKQFQAKVIEIPYGKENRLSMLIMLPNEGVSLEDMFQKFGNTSLDVIFEELKKSVENFSEDEVDLLLPRFKIESKIEMTETLETMDIRDLFDQAKANLPGISNLPLFVSKVIHKAVIEVSESGTEAAAVTASEFSNRIGIIRFEANRPFCYMIIEKTTNVITFGGFYKEPSLY